MPHRKNQAHPFHGATCMVTSPTLNRPRIQDTYCYLGAGATYQFNVFSSDIEDVIQDEVDAVLPGANANFDLDDSFGVNALVGYRAVSWFAIELQYEWIDEYDIQGSTDAPVPAPGGEFIPDFGDRGRSTRRVAPLARMSIRALRQ